ncbi:hypothetical protein Tco_1266026 [Tanacetum coccineum]
MVLEEKTVELDEGQAGSDPGKTPESLPPPEHEHMDEDQAGPVTPLIRVPSDLASGGVTLSNISSTKHKERPLRL